MPQIFSRMDSSNWLTPSIADILDQGAAPPGGDGSIRERMLTIQQELADLDTPARIVNVRSMPSYTLYVARPETIGRLGNRRQVTSAELRRSIGQIAERHKDWMLGFLPQLQDTAEAVGILLRTEEHRPQSLRRLLVRSNFRNYESTLAFTLGITLEQQLLVRDIVELKHLLVIGSNKAKQHFIRGTLLTLMLLNTPGELRIALMGPNSDAYRDFVSTPHALGRLLAQIDDAQRLLDGLIKEIQRRQQMIEEAGAISIDEYNQQLREQGKTEFPRIILVIDAVSDPTWQNAKDKWAPAVMELVTHGANTGIHLIISAAEQVDEHIPSEIVESIRVKVIMRAVAGDIGDNLENFHPSLLRFIDGFVVDGDAGITPVELCAISNQEVQRAVSYWQEASKRRFEEGLKTSTSMTGVTDILKPIPEAKAVDPAPPVPAKPSAEILARATRALADIVAKPTPNGHSLNILQQAQALASYLGWLGIGPLHDIFGLSFEDARSILQELQARQILESSDSPTPRFLLATQLHQLTD